MKFEECPKCQRPQFGYNDNFKVYICGACKFADKERFIPEEVIGYNNFKKYMKKYIREEIPKAQESQELDPKDDKESKRELKRLKKEKCMAEEKEKNEKLKGNS